MLFHSYIFVLLFLPLVWLGYFCLIKKGNSCSVSIWLIAASLTFYGYLNPYYVILILISVAGNYSIGRHLALRCGDKTVIYRKWLLGGGIAMNILILVYFKYAMMLADLWNVVTEIHISIGDIIVPAALSFYTFQQIAFLVDSYKNKITREEYNLLDYCLFVTFFPQLIAGPIVKHSEMAAQLKKPDAKDWGMKWAVALSLFTIGLFKKVVIADYLAGQSVPFFDGVMQGQIVSAVAMWYHSACYFFYYYFDFSAYCDMAIAIAWLFGVRLPVNFASPLKASSLIVAWQRWHITVCRFFREYFYRYLSFRKSGSVGFIAAVLLTMALAGLWHGKSLTLLVWGVLQGVLLLLNYQLRKYSFVYIPKAVGRLLILLNAIWMLPFFVSDSFANLPSIYAALSGEGGIGSVQSLSPEQWGIFCIISFIIYFLPNAYQWLGRYNPALPVRGYPATYITGQDTVWIKWKPTWVWAIIIGVMFSLCLFAMTNPQAFLYFRF